MRRLRLFLIFFIFLGFSKSSYAQHQGWHLKDKEQDGYWGISLQKAYDFLNSTNRNPNIVIVGVIDSGIDTAHVDLKNRLWINPKDQSKNSKDEDKNGYMDDVHGWNFLSDQDGSSFVDKDSYELHRLYWGYKDKFSNIPAEKIKKRDMPVFLEWKRAEAEVMVIKNDPRSNKPLEMFKNWTWADSVISVAVGKKKYNFEDIQNYTPTDPRTLDYKKQFEQFHSTNSKITNKNIFDGLFSIMKIDNIVGAFEPPPNYRSNIVSDNPANIKDRYYGSGTLFFQSKAAEHGTHVAGIIAAERNNGNTMDGIAESARIMTIRAIPNGDEHDKDVALAIRYAVDNGAKIINMSFGKGYSAQKQWVDEAVKYAGKKGVLLIHAAGNSSLCIDSIANYPNRKFLKGYIAKNWLSVGASGDEKLGNVLAPFSNYGKENVDVFAPGMEIYSTLPGSDNYGNLSGTSMATPIVSGIAALLMSYYPELSVLDVKNIIIKSVRVPESLVNLPKGNNKKVRLDSISQTGGIVNAYDAVLLADKMVNKIRVKN